MKSKQQAYDSYLEMGVEKADIVENVFGAYDTKGFAEHYVAMDPAILKALKSNGSTMIKGDPEIIHGRFMTGLNIYMGGYHSVIDEIQAVNSGKTYGKIFPYGEELVVLAKRSSKKHGVSKGMMMFRLVDSMEGTMVIKENRAFNDGEQDEVFDTMFNKGIDMMRVVGDSFLVERN